MHQVFDRFLNHWAHGSSEYISNPPQDVSALPLEQSICFSDPMAGLLVVRSTEEFGFFLKSKGFGSFLEMVVLFYHSLFMQVWHLDMRKLKPALFKASVPWSWPDRDPDVACMALIGKFPVEIRLWTQLTEQEKETWKNTKKS